MDEYAIYRNYQKIMQYNEQQRRVMVIDREEMEYWRNFFKDEPADFKPEPESDKPF